MSENTAIGEFKGSMVICQTGQGVEMRGTLIRLSRYLAVFEIYNPTLVLRASEVLTDLKIVIQDRTIYSGRAVVSNLVAASSTAICEVKLDENKFDIVSFLPAETNARIADGFTQFLDYWQKIYRLQPEFKVVIADMQTFLTDLRLWLEQVELAIRATPAGDRAKLEQDIAQQLRPSVVGAINNLFERFETIASRVDQDLVPAHQAFGKRQLLPLLLSSPFVARTYNKPLGYAGDYEMVNMMFRDGAEGGSLFAKMINLYALQLPPILGHRNRIDLLERRLVEETRRAAAANRALRVFNLGCGPAHEIQRFLANDPVSDHARFTLLDFNDETLAHTGRILNDLRNRHGRRTEIKLEKKSVHQMLKQADRGIQQPATAGYDVVVCAGLFDYLSDKVCRKLLEIFYSMLSPGGLLIATNVDEHPARNEMEYFLEWHLIHRNTEKMRSLAPNRSPPENVSLMRDATAVNVFMDVRKSNV